MARVIRVEEKKNGARAFVNETPIFEQISCSLAECARGATDRSELGLRQRVVARAKARHYLRTHSS